MKVRLLFPYLFYFFPCDEFMEGGLLSFGGRCLCVSVYLAYRVPMERWPKCLNFKLTILNCYLVT